MFDYIFYVTVSFYLCYSYYCIFKTFLSFFFSWIEIMLFGYNFSNSFLESQHSYFPSFKHCNIINFCFVHFFWKRVYELFCENIFHSLETSRICLFQITVSISLDVVSFCLFMWPGLFKTHFSYVLFCVAKFLITPSKVVTENDLDSFLMHSKTEHKNRSFCRKTAPSLIRIYFCE